MAGLGSAIAAWFVVRDCTEASRFGWAVGSATGALIDIVLIVTILQARRLNSGTMTDTMAESVALRASRLVVSLLVPVLWFACLYETWGPWSACLLVALSGATAIMVGGFCLLVMFTAANQIGVRSIR